MNDTLVLAQRPRIDRTDQAIAVAAVFVFGLILLIFQPVLSTPATVSQLTIRDTSAWPVDIAIAGPSPSAAWLPLGTADAGDNQWTDVLDPGGVWRVRFSYDGNSYYEQLSRTAIERNRWTIVVPARVDAAIRASGADAPPTDAGS